MSYQPDQQPIRHTCGACRRPSPAPHDKVALVVPTVGEPYALIECDLCSATTQRFLTITEVGYLVNAGVRPPTQRMPAATTGIDWPFELLEWRHGLRLAKPLTEQQIDAEVTHFANRIQHVTLLATFARQGMDPKLIPGNGW